MGNTLVLFALFKNFINWYFKSKYKSLQQCEMQTVFLELHVKNRTKKQSWMETLMLWKIGAQFKHLQSQAEFYYL